MQASERSSVPQSGATARFNIGKLFKWMYSKNSPATHPSPPKRSAPYNLALREFLKWNKKNNYPSYPVTVTAGDRGVDNCHLSWTFSRISQCEDGFLVVGFVHVSPESRITKNDEIVTIAIATNTISSECWHFWFDEDMQLVTTQTRQPHEGELNLEDTKDDILDDRPGEENDPWATPGTH